MFTKLAFRPTEFLSTQMFKPKLKVGTTVLIHWEVYIVRCAQYSWTSLHSWRFLWENEWRSGSSRQSRSLTRFSRNCRSSLPISPAAAPLVFAWLYCSPKPPATQVTVGQDSTPREKLGSSILVSSFSG